MANQINIDKAAQKIAQQLETLQVSVVVEILNSVQQIQRAGTAATLIEILDQFNFKELVRIKAQNIIATYNNAHTQVLIDTKMFAEISEETLQAITNFSTSTFTDKLDNMANVMKSEIVKGALGEATEQGIIQAIQQQAGLSNAQMRTLVTTGLNDYSASVGKIMIDESPENEKFRYVGAIDDRTRPFCLRVWEAGPMTKKEIAKRFPTNDEGGDTYIRRGGYNCRHQWFPVEASDESKDVRKDAG